MSRDSGRRGMTARPLMSTVDKAVQRHCTGVPDIHFWACVSGRFRYYWGWCEPHLAWPHEAYMWTDCRASSAEQVQVLISEIIFSVKSYFALNKLRWHTHTCARLQQNRLLTLGFPYLLRCHKKSIFSEEYGGWGVLQVKGYVHERVGWGPSQKQQDKEKSSIYCIIPEVRGGTLG